MWKSSLLIAAVAALCFAQTASDFESAPVNRVATKLACSCGCNLNMACRMDPYPCGMCRNAKLKIIAMQSQGKSDQQILDAFVAENGKDALATPPGPMGVIGPWGALALGAILVVFLIRRLSQKPAPAAATPEAAAVDSPALEKYREQIEKDLAKLD
ncbi:MAG TPA: cytochrome c-type biogenesis protein CcmH [Bryobacteraceae bacterium]|nr:cytochrome c-type biogenesis protein CcmH [Bryobacteraceae bacterium]